MPLCWSGNALVNDPAEIIALMRIDKGVMHAHIRQPTGQDQRVNFQPTEQNFEICPVKGRIAPFLDQVIAGTEIQNLACDVGFRVIVKTVDIFIPIQFAAEIDKVCTMNFLNEDDRDTGLRAMSITARLRAIRSA